MSYTENPIPEIGTHLFGARRVNQWDIDQALRLREQFKTEATERDGALYWNRSGNAVPKDCFADAFCTPSAEHLAAYEKQTDEAVAAYIEARKNYVPSEEDLFEMRAAFGPGETVVDAITGQRFKL